MRVKFFNLFLLSALSFSVAAQIPNNGFESWTLMGTYSNPNDWGTLNNTTAAAGVYTATKGTPGSPGTAYLKLTSKTVAGLGVVNGIAVSGVLDSITRLPKSGFAYNQRPANLTGKWQHMIYGASQGKINAVLTRWDAVNNVRVPVASINYTLSGMAMSWAAFTLPFVYTDGGLPDTCIITLMASGTAPTNNDYLWVDNLAFTGSVIGIENTTASTNLISVFPNPTHDEIKIAVSSAQQQNGVIELLDMNGKIISSKKISINLNTSSESIDAKLLQSGVYFVRLTSESGTEVKKIIIE